MNGIGSSAIAGPPLPPNRVASIWAFAPTILAYCFASVGLGLLNSGILHTVPLPVCLATWHMGMTALVSWCARFYLLSRMGADAEPSKSVQNLSVYQMLPIAALLALAVQAELKAQILLSPSLAATLGAVDPPVVYLFCCLAGLDDFLSSKLKAVVLLSLSVVLANAVELGQFHGGGILCQVIGSLCECGKLTLIAKAVDTSGIGRAAKIVDLLAVLFQYSFLAVPFLMALAFTTELPSLTADRRQALMDEVGIVWAVFNGLQAFALNGAGLLMIAQLDPVVYVVVGSLKEAVAVGTSAILLSAPISLQELSGHMLALVSVQVFNSVRQDPEAFQGQAGFFGALWASTREALKKITGGTSGKEAETAQRRAAALALQAELDGELDQVVGSELEKVAARALNIDFPSESGQQADSVEEMLLPPKRPFTPGCSPKDTEMDEWLPLESSSSTSNQKSSKEPHCDVFADDEPRPKSSKSKADAATKQPHPSDADIGSKAEVFEIGDDQDDDEQSHLNPSPNS